MEEILFDERSLPNHPNGKQKYRKKGLMFVPVLMIYAIIIIHGYLGSSIFNITLFLMCITYLMIFYPVVSYIFGLDELVIYENGIQLPEKFFKNIIRRTHNILPLREIKNIVKSSSYPTENFTVFTIVDKKNRVWYIRKCFINDINRLSDLLIQISSEKEIEYNDYSETFNKDPVK